MPQRRFRSSVGRFPTGGTVDLGVGSDKLTLFNANNTVTVVNVESIIGGSMSDQVTMSGSVVSVVDLSAGNDSLTLFSAAKNVVTIANIETVIGGTGADQVFLSNTITGGIFNLGLGDDTVTLAGDVSQYAYGDGCRNAHRWLGQRSDIPRRSNYEWHVQLRRRCGQAYLVQYRRQYAYRRQSRNFNREHGHPTSSHWARPVCRRWIWGRATTPLTLTQNSTNTLTINNVETLAGAGGDDVVHLGGQVTAGTFDLAAGSGDRLYLFNAATNTATIRSVEFLIGGTGSDQIVMDARITSGVTTLAPVPTS